MAKESLKDLSVSITPIKRTREQQQEDLPCAQEEIDAYKVWLSKLKQENPRTELKDEFRQQTIETYKEWLTLQGDLLGDDITDDGGTSTENGENDSSQARKNWPSHARRPNKAGNGQCTGGRKKGRGPLKGHSIAFKRIKSGCQKLPIQFSSRLGGPQGENYRSFIDEVVMFTRKRAPLIGVRSWKDISSDVKNAIVTDLKNRWDFGNTRDVDGKILGLARSRYADWRSTLSTTYRAYESDAKRAKNKPEDVDIVEWHYLMKYFATENFQAVSKKNTTCRGKQQVQHGGGPKPFSQHSYEKRNPEIGEEPNDIELWMITHSKNGKWSNNAAHDVYDNAVCNLRAKELELEKDGLTNEEQNIVFQSSYNEIIQCKRPTIHGHGYMAKYPMRVELMEAQIKLARDTAAEKEKNKNLEGEVQRLREELADQTAQTDKKVEEATQKIQEEEKIKREEMRKQIKEDMAVFFAKQTQGLALQTNTPSSTLTVCAARQGTTGQENGNTVNSKLTRNLFPTNNRNGANFISSQQLSKAANKGRVTRMMQIEWSHGQVFELIHIILSWNLQ
ncbi:hypothetical protein U9M48_013626 [Paspalum notatum var. saurae]|uniref:Uncharacterized protein n=1 Tax=Paspalum notatum var. saurae TaxID=547442 RepID=A0AAQ3SZU2_PASNO